MDIPVPVVPLLRRLRSVLEPGPLGAVVADLGSWRIGSSRKRFFKLIVEAELDDLLADPDFFLAACAKIRIRSKTLLRHAVLPPRSPGTAIDLIGRLMSAGALNVFSESACNELNHMLVRWKPLELRRALLTGIIGELDSYAQAGLFLRGLLDSDACELGSQGIDDILRAVLADVRNADLAGEPADLASELPEEYACLVNACVGFDGKDSDADSDGNLAGFVVSDSDVEFTGSEGSRSSTEKPHIDYKTDDSDVYVNNFHKGGPATSAAVQHVDRKRKRDCRAL